MSMFAEFLPLLDPKFLTQILHLLCREFGSTALGRRLGGLVIRSMWLGGLIMPALRSIVTESRSGRGSGKTLARRLGLIATVCAVHYAVAPTSIPGAVLIAGWLGAAQEWQARSGEGMLPACMPFAFCIALLVWGAPWWRERDLRLQPAVRRGTCRIEN